MGRKFIILFCFISLLNVVDHKDKPWIVNTDTTTSRSQSGHLLMQHVLYF